MPNFECVVCHQQVTYPAADYDYHKSLGWRCAFHYSIFYSREYERNVKGGTTLFSPMGSALGDLVFFHLIKREYLADNPDENVVFLGWCDPAQVFAQYKPVKFFWAAETNFIVRPERGVIPFTLATEASVYAEHGVYPQLWFEPKKIEVPEKYIVLHLRCIGKATMKNVEPYFANKIIYFLDELIENGLVDKVIVIGNDDHDECIYLPPWAVDYRKKLSLEEMAFVLQHCDLFVGKDSGVAHLAGAAGADVIAWGYADKRWFARGKGSIQCLLKAESNPESIINLINSHFGIKIVTNIKEVEA